MSLSFLHCPEPFTQFRFLPQVSLRGAVLAPQDEVCTFTNKPPAIWDRDFTRVIPNLLKTQTLQLDTPNWVETRIFSKGFDFSLLHPSLNSAFSNANTVLVASHVVAVNRLQDRLKGKFSVSLKIDQLNTKNCTSTTTSASTVLLFSLVKIRNWFYSYEQSYWYLTYKKLKEWLIFFPRQH